MYYMLSKQEKNKILTWLFMKLKGWYFQQLKRMAKYMFKIAFILYTNSVLNMFFVK